MTAKTMERSEIIGGYATNAAALQLTNPSKNNAFGAFEWLREKPPQFSIRKSDPVPQRSKVRLFSHSIRFL
jgi:hypothetical protein